METLSGTQNHRVSDRIWDTESGIRPLISAAPGRKSVNGLYPQGLPIEPKRPSFGVPGVWEPVKPVPQDPYPIFQLLPEGIRKFIMTEPGKASEKDGYGTPYRAYREIEANKLGVEFTDNAYLMIEAAHLAHFLGMGDRVSEIKVDKQNVSLVVKQYDPALGADRLVESHLLSDVIFDIAQIKRRVAAGKDIPNYIAGICESIKCLLDTQKKYVKEPKFKDLDSFLEIYFGSEVYKNTLIPLVESHQKREDRKRQATDQDRKAPVVPVLTFRLSEP